MRFEAVFGVNPGYHHYNYDPTPLGKMAGVWNESMELCRQNTGMQISGVICQGLVVYSEKLGCPGGGVDVVTVTGEFNPEFHRFVELWKDAVRAVVRQCMRVLEQETVTLSFVESSLEYITKDSL